MRACPRQPPTPASPAPRPGPGRSGCGATCAEGRRRRWGPGSTPAWRRTAPGGGRDGPRGRAGRSDGREGAETPLGLGWGWRRTGGGVGERLRRGSCGAAAWERPDSVLLMAAGCPGSDSWAPLEAATASLGRRGRVPAGRCSGWIDCGCEPGALADPRNRQRTREMSRRWDQRARRRGGPPREAPTMIPSRRIPCSRASTARRPAATSAHATIRRCGGGPAASPCCGSGCPGSRGDRGSWAATTRCSARPVPWHPPPFCGYNRRFMRRGVAFGPPSGAQRRASPLGATCNFVMRQ